MYKNYNSLKDDFAYDLLFTINKNDHLEFNDETRSHLRNLLVAGILSLKFIEDNLNDNNMNQDWNWKVASRSPHLTLDFVLKHIDKGLDWKHISSCNFINNDFIDKYPDKSYCWKSLTVNDSIIITEDFVSKYCYKPLDWKFLSAHPSISINFIDKLDLNVGGNLIKPNWFSWEVSKRKDITIQFITKYKDFNFNWNAIIKNENINIIDMIELLDKLKKTQWGFWYYMSLRDDITEEVLEKYPYKRWNWWWISKHKNITFEVVKRHPDWNWDWAYLPTNPNITLDMIKDNMDMPWNFKHITSNLSNNMIDNWVNINRRELIASRRIHRFWRDVNYNPIYKRARHNIIKKLSS